MNNKSLIMATLVFVSFVVGCDRRKENNKKTVRDEYAFENAIWVDSHPVAGRIYSLKNPNVVGGVRSTHKSNLYYIPSDPDVTVAVLVKSNSDYSDGELLKQGMYKYEGNESCEIDDAVEMGDNLRMVRRSVKCRSFVEVVKPRIVVPTRKSSPGHDQ